MQNEINVCKKLWEKAGEGKANGYDTKPVKKNQNKFGKMS
jgi:hypothetical protein